MKEPESKSDERSHLTLKRILEVVKQEWQDKPVLFYWMLTYQLVGTIMCMFYFYYQQKISDLASWQVSLIMLIGSGFSLLAVYLASQIGKKWNSNQVFPILVALTGLALFLVGVKTPFAYLCVYLFMPFTNPSTTMIYKHICHPVCEQPCWVSIRWCLVYLWLSFSHWLVGSLIAVAL